MSLAIAAIALKAAAPMLGGFFANKEARAQARVEQENARLSLLSGERDVEDIMRDERQMAGDALAMMAGSGLALGVGSSASVLEESARQRERAIRVRRDQATSESDNYQQAAKDARAAARNAMIMGVVSGVASAIGGVDAMNQQDRSTTQRRKERRVMLGRKG